jgi:hypothetical protein
MTADLSIILDRLTTTDEVIDSDGWEPSPTVDYLGDGEVDDAVLGLLAVAVLEHTRAITRCDYDAAWRIAEEVEGLTSMLSPSPYTDEGV